MSITKGDPKNLSNGVKRKVKVLSVEPVTFDLPEAPPVIAPPVMVPMPSVAGNDLPFNLPQYDTQAAEAISANGQFSPPPVIPPPLPQGEGQEMPPDNVLPDPNAQQTPPQFADATGANPFASQMMPPDTRSVTLPNAPAPPTLPDPVKEQQEREQARQNALRLAAILPLAGMLIGGRHGAEYANRYLPGAAAGAVGGADALVQERQNAANQKLSMGAAADQQVYQQGMARAKFEQDAITDTNKARDTWNKYLQSVQELQIKDQQGLRESDQERAKIGKEWTGMLADLTPDSQEKLISSMDPNFLQRYNITLPQGGVEKRNPNEPTLMTTLQKQLDHQYDLLRANPSLLSGAGGAAIVSRIAEYENAMGIAPGASLPPDVFNQMSAKEKVQLQVQLMQAQTGQMNAQTGQARLGEEVRHNQATEGIARVQAQLRSQEIQLRAVAASGDPMKMYQAESKYIQSLVAQKQKLTGGGINSLTGRWNPTDAESLKTAAPTIAWLDQQIAIHSSAANRYGQASGLPPVSLPGGQPAQPVAPRATVTPTAKPAAAAKPSTGGDADYNAWLQKGKSLGVPVGN